METKKRMIEIPDDGIVRIPIKCGDTTVGEKRIDLRFLPTVNAVEVKSKVGDYVYALWEAPVKLKYIIYCAEVKEIRISMRNCRLTTTYILEPIDYRGHRREYRAEEFGTLVFTDKEDAERKLYPCEHCISGTYRSCEGCSVGERKEDGTP